MTSTAQQGLSVSDVARLLNCSPQMISRAFYDRLLPDAWAPMIAGRRIIDPARVEDVAAVLRKTGKISPQLAR